MKNDEVASCVKHYSCHAALDDLNVKGDNTENLSTTVILFFLLLTVYIVDTLHNLNQIYVQWDCVIVLGCNKYLNHFCAFVHMKRQHRICFSVYLFIKLKWLHTGAQALVWALLCWRRSTINDSWWFYHVASDTPAKNKHFFGEGRSLSLVGGKGSAQTKVYGQTSVNTTPYNENCLLTVTQKSTRKKLDT